MFFFLAQMESRKALSAIERGEELKHAAVPSNLPKQVSEESLAETRWPQAVFAHQVFEL